MTVVLSPQTDINALIPLILEGTAVQGALGGGHGRRADLGDGSFGAGGRLDGVLDVALGGACPRGGAGREGEETHLGR
ncbi:hypothetical protein CONLIGDRAFT_632215 [Coniochaeta ligniaria NRRL 30616]|uniref:Uncharacterized protein n=1 Tax=Coniochaeta ligniaria NRRL 30616 TaxID=1408157 RepID=A0A1J7ISH2_9PEZI|nr:hypothetical protein CONLIGDRAFT_632215 [Coniochaeta ligniaria NRRL 30616]